MSRLSVYDVAVVGAGLFGSIIAKALRGLGKSVVVFDARYPEAGSKPAACLMKPGWFSALGKAVYDPALATLERLYGLQELQFRVSTGVKVKVFWVSPAKILSEPHEVGPVRLLRRGKHWVFGADDQFEARMVVVAAGIWTSLLVPEVQQKGQAGVAFLWPQETIEQPFVKVWAPYKQIVGFNRGDGLWISDGTAILRRNWTGAREEQCLNRCVRAVGQDLDHSPPVRLFGIRPYHAMKPCYLAEVRPQLWVATGGAKNGTLAAAWCAHELVRKLQ